MRARRINQSLLHKLVDRCTLKARSWTHLNIAQQLTVIELRACSFDGSIFIINDAVSSWLRERNQQILSIAGLRVA